MGCCSAVVVASDFGSEGRWFESSLHPALFTRSPGNKDTLEVFSSAFVLSRE